MPEKQIQEVAEQTVYFDGKPRFMDISAVINLLNHYGFHKDDVDYCREEGGNPQKYKVRIIVETEKVD